MLSRAFDIGYAVLCELSGHNAEQKVRAKLAAVSNFVQIQSNKTSVVCSSEENNLS